MIAVLLNMLQAGFLRLGLEGRVAYEHGLSSIPGAKSYSAINLSMQRVVVACANRTPMVHPGSVSSPLQSLQRGKPRTRNHHTSMV